MESHFTIVIIACFSLISVVHTQYENLSERCSSGGITKCYNLYKHMLNTPMSWYQANEHCRSIGQSLAAIPDADTQVVIQELVASISQTQGAWTAGQTSNDTTWRLQDGTAFTGAVTGESEIQNCVGASEDNGRLVLFQERCHLKANFLGAEAKPLCEVTRPGGCQAGETHSTLNNKICYKILTTPCTWFEAVQLCQEYDPSASLAHTYVHTNEFLTLAYDLTPSGTMLWIGVIRRPWFWNQYGVFLNSRTLDYTHWAEALSTSGGYHYLTEPPDCLYVSIPGAGWYSTQCNDSATKRYFICERERQPTAAPTVTTSPTPATTPAPTPETTPATTTTTLKSNTGASNAQSGGWRIEYVGIIIAAIVMIGIIIVVVIVVCRRKRKEEAKPQSEVRFERRPAPNAQIQQQPPPQGYVKREQPRDKAARHKYQKKNKKAQPQQDLGYESVGKNNEAYYFDMPDDQRLVVHNSAERNLPTRMPNNNVAQGVQAPEEVAKQQLATQRSLSVHSRTNPEQFVERAFEGIY